MTPRLFRLLAALAAVVGFACGAAQSTDQHPPSPCTLLQTSDVSQATGWTLLEPPKPQTANGETFCLYKTDQGRIVTEFQNFDSLKRQLIQDHAGFTNDDQSLSPAQLVYYTSGGPSVAVRPGAGWEFTIFSSSDLLTHGQLTELAKKAIQNLK